MSDLSTAEIEAILDACADLVSEQFIIPLLLAMGTLTTAIAMDSPTKGEAMAQALKRQAQDCPDAARAMLLSLAGLAAPDSSPTPPTSPKDAVRTALRLIQGGNRGGAGSGPGVGTS